MLSALRANWVCTWCRLTGGRLREGAARQQVVWLENYPIAVFGPASTGASLAYIQPDHLGTPRNIIDAVRNVSVWRWDLQGEAFGADAANEDPDGDGAAYKFPLRFPGQQYTLQTGLYYNYQRDYDPIVGRYAQSDPIGLLGGVGTYGYVAGSPLSIVDPDGRQARAIRGYNPPGYMQGPSGEYTVEGYPSHSDLPRGDYPAAPPSLAYWSTLGKVVMSMLSDQMAGGIWGALSRNNEECPVHGTEGIDYKKNTGTRIERKKGGFADANADFDNAWPSNVVDKGNGVRVGILEDGRKIVVRPSSTDNIPTIEVQSGNGRIKIRYIE